MKLVHVLREDGEVPKALGSSFRFRAVLNTREMNVLREISETLNEIVSHAFYVSF